MSISSELRLLGSKERAIQSARYFKTGKGEYGEGEKAKVYGHSSLKASLPKEAFSIKY